MKRLTRKQAKLARAKVRDPEASLTELGQRAGYADKAHTHRALTTEHVQERIRKLMDANPKLTEIALTRKLADGLDAHETKFFAHEGEVIDEREVVDFGTRHRYLETALNLRGLQEKRVHVTNENEPAQVLVALVAQALAAARSAGVLRVIDAEAADK